MVLKGVEGRFFEGVGEGNEGKGCVRVRKTAKAG